MESIKTVNTMCLNCAKYGNECGGTASTVWTGCVYKTKKEETAEERAARMFEYYRRDLAKLGDQHGRIRYNCVEYLCQFPNINPEEMAATLIVDGYQIVFDDSSITAKANSAKERAVGKMLLHLEYLKDTKQASEKKEARTA